MKKTHYKFAFALLLVQVCLSVTLIFSSVNHLLIVFSHFSMEFLIFSLIDLRIPLHILGRNSSFISGSIKKNELGCKLRNWALKLGWVHSQLDSEARLAAFIIWIYHLLAVWSRTSYPTSLSCFLLWKMGKMIIVPISHCHRIQQIRTQ